MRTTSLLEEEEEHDRHVHQSRWRLGFTRPPGCPSGPRGRATGLLPKTPSGVFARDPAALAGTGWVPEGAAWRVRAAFLAVVETLRLGQGARGPSSRRACLHGLMVLRPGWPPQQEVALQLPRGVTLRGGPGVPRWPRVQVPSRVFCPPSLASFEGRAPVLTSGFLGGGLHRAPGLPLGLCHGGVSRVCGARAVVGGQPCRGIPTAVVAPEPAGKTGTGSRAGSLAELCSRVPSVLPVSVAHTRPG